MNFLPSPLIVAALTGSTVLSFRRVCMKIACPLAVLLSASTISSQAHADQPSKENTGQLAICADLGAPNKLPAAACTPRAETLEYLNTALHQGWVELDSDFEGKRSYVSFPPETNPFQIAQPMRLYLRRDRNTEAVALTPGKTASAATSVETVDLNCAQSEATVVSTAYFDAKGNPLGSSKMAKPKVERIKLPYRSPLSEVCRRDYIFQLAENGDEYLLTIKRLGRAIIRNALPDRTIPLPGKAAEPK